MPHQKKNYDNSHNNMSNFHYQLQRGKWLKIYLSQQPDEMNPKFNKTVYNEIVKCAPSETYFLPIDKPNMSLLKHSVSELF